jgi:hypothetical protein
LQTYPGRESFLSAEEYTPEHLRVNLPWKNQDGKKRYCREVYFEAYF